MRGVLRTSEAYVDRSPVLVAFELRDAAGNIRVATGGVTVTLTVSRSGGGSEAAVRAVVLHRYGVLPGRRGVTAEPRTRAAAAAKKALRPAEQSGI